MFRPTNQRYSRLYRWPLRPTGARCGWRTGSAAAGPEQHLRRHRGAARRRTPRRTRGSSSPAAHRPRRAACAAGCRRHALFKADVAEHRPLEVLVASHRPRLGCSPMVSDHTGRGQRRRGFFNGLQEAAELALHCIPPPPAPFLSVCCKPRWPTAAVAWTWCGSGPHVRSNSATNWSRSQRPGRQAARQPDPLAAVLPRPPACPPKRAMRWLDAPGLEPLMGATAA